MSTLTESQARRAHVACTFASGAASGAASTSASASASAERSERVQQMRSRPRASAG